MDNNNSSDKKNNNNNNKNKYYNKKKNINISNTNNKNNTFSTTEITITTLVLLLLLLIQFGSDCDWYCCCCIPYIIGLIDINSNNNSNNNNTYCHSYRENSNNNNLYYYYNKENSHLIMSDPNYISNSTIRGEYTCTYQNWNGILYACIDSIQFYSNFFLFEKKLILKWDDIRYVRQMEASSNSNNNTNNNNDIRNSSIVTNEENVIEVVMTDDMTIHRFGLYNTSTSKVWKLLIQLQNESLLASHHNDINIHIDNIDSNNNLPSPSNTDDYNSPSFRRSVRRRNSDPNRFSFAVVDKAMLDKEFGNEFDDIVVHDDTVEVQEKGDHTNLSTTQQQQQSFATTTSTSSNGIIDSANNKFTTESVVTTTNTTILTNSISTNTNMNNSLVGVPKIVPINVSMELAEIEKTTGAILLQPISCTFMDHNHNHNNNPINGKFYTGHDAMYFAATRSFFNWDQCQIIIQWNTIQAIRTLVQKETSNDNNDQKKKKCIGISIIISSEPKLVYRFIGIDNANQVWASLTAIHKDHEVLAPDSDAAGTGGGSGVANGDSTDPNVESRRRQSQRLYRANSDPMFAIQRGIIESDANGVDDNKGSSTTPATSSTFVMAMDTMKESTTTSTIHAKKVSFRATGGDGQVQSLDMTDEEITITHQLTSSLMNIPIDNEDQVSWYNATQSNTKLYNNVIGNNVTLQHCSDIDTFYKLFLSNRAKYSLYDQFLQTRGDKNIEVEDWHDDDDDDDDNNNNNSNNTFQSKKRMVKYIHPVNAPMAPPQATAQKEQVYKHYGKSTGLLIETNTFVHDVPMADCFHIADRIIISPNTNTTTNRSSISITIAFGLNFTKSTMFKGIITKKSTSEVTALIKAMIEYIQDSLNKEHELKISSMISQTSMDDKNGNNDLLNVNNVSASINTTSCTAQRQEEPEKVDDTVKEPLKPIPVEKDGIDSNLVEKFNDLVNTIVEKVKNIEDISQVPWTPVLLAAVIVLLLFVACVQINILYELRAIRKLHMLK